MLPGWFEQKLMAHAHQCLEKELTKVEADGSEQTEDDPMFSMDTPMGKAMFKAKQFITAAYYKFLDGHVGPHYHNG